MKNIFIARIVTILLIGSVSSCASTENKENNNQEKVSQMTFPIYGNWCGPMHPAEGLNPTPVDATDLACQRHDACYGEKGYFSSECDGNLLVELDVADAPTSPQEEAARYAIAEYFKEAIKLGTKYKSEVDFAKNVVEKAGKKKAEKKKAGKK